MSNNSENGITGGLNTTLPIAMTVSAFTAVAWYNVVELNVMIWLTFRRHSGLYFYSLLASSWGIAVYALAFLMKFFQVWTNDYVSVAFITIGWYAMVTGQSLVLYSRLHLVVRDRRKIRWVLWMILADVVLFHFPTTVLTFGANSSKAALFVEPYSIMEKIQVTAFAIQEFIISGLYLYETRRILQPSATFQKKRTRRVMHHLIYVNVLIILMDITLLCMEYANLYELQITFKGTLYSIKLGLEFAVLNSLKSLTANANNSDDGGTYTHSTTVRNVGLETFNGNNGGGGGNMGSKARNTFTTSSAAVAAGGEHKLDDLPNNIAAYSVFASRSLNSPFAIADMDDNVVVKTTEIKIKTEMMNGSTGDGGGDTDVEKDDDDERGGRDDSLRVNNNGTSGRHHRPGSSPASSEVEFAHHDGF